MRPTLILLLSSLLAPGQDLPCSALPLTAEGVLTGSTMGLTDSLVPRSCGALFPIAMNAPDAWYRFTSQGDGSILFETCGAGTTYDSVLVLYGGPNCMNLNELACNDDACGARSRLLVPVSAGRTYWLRVTGVTFASGDYELFVATTPGVFTPVTNARIGLNSRGFQSPSCSDVGLPSGPSIPVSVTLASEVPFSGLVIAAAGDCTSPGLPTGAPETFDLEYATLVWVVDGTGANLLGSGSIWNQLAMTDAQGDFTLSATLALSPGPSFAFQAGVLDPAQANGIDVTQALRLEGL